MDLACSFPAPRRMKVTTTALIHSSSPPGFIANQKELSTRGKVKPHNGCVVTENDKIILLKRVYTSPVRRSSRVRRKGCLVMSTPMPKRRHSVPAHTVTVNSQQTWPRCCPKSAEPAPLNTVNGETTEAPGVSTLSNLTSPPTTENDRFHWLDETPRRRLSVRITETAEIRKRLAEAGMPRLSLCADPDATTPGQYPVPQNCLSQNENYASPCGYVAEPGEPKVSKCDTKSMFDPSTYLGSVFPDLQCTNSSFGSDETDCVSKNVVGGELLSLSKTSPRRKRVHVNSEDFMNGFFHASSESSMETESLDSSDELSRDAGDEVLCISPLPFENSEMSFSFTPIQNEQSRHLRLELPKCLLSEHEQPAVNVDMDEFLASPGSSPVSSISVDETVNCSLSSRSPGSILRVDLGRNNPLSPLASPVGSKTRCRDVEYPSPRKNGMRPVGLLKLTMSSPASTSTETSSIKSLEYPDQQTDDVCIVNLTPNNRVYNSLKDKEPSPTYASQANTESPSSPRNTSIGSEQIKCKQNTPDALSTQLGMKRNSPLVPLKSPELCLSPVRCTKENNDFQDFSEFDFLASDESTLLAQASRQTEVFSKPVSPEKVLNYSFNHLAQSSDDQSCLQCHSDHHRSLQPPKESVEVSSLPREENVCDNHQQVINKNYAPTYHKPSVSNSIGVKDSDEVWTSVPDFRLDDFEAPSRKKNTFARRSSMRIAKRMSLMVAEEENQKDEEDDYSGKNMQLKTTETSKLETIVVVKRKRGRPRKILQESQSNDNHCLEQQNTANSIPSTQSMETQFTMVAPNPYLSTDITLPVPGTEEQFKFQFDNDPKPNLVKKSRRKSRRCVARLHPDLLPLAAGDSCSNTSNLPADSEDKRNDKKDSMLFESSMTLINCYRSVDESATTQFSTHDREMSQELPETKLPSWRASNDKSGGTGKRRRSIRLLTASLNQEEDTCAPSGQMSQEDEAKALNLCVSPTQEEENLMNNLESETAVPSNLEADNGTGEAGLYSKEHIIEIEKENQIYTSARVSNLAETYSLSPNNVFVDISRPFYADLVASSALDKASSDNEPEENTTSSRPKRRRSGVTLSSVRKREVKCKKRSGSSDEEAVKELYLKRGESKALKQSNLETIFEEVHIGKTGSPVYAGSRKCKRAVTFLEHPWLPRKRKKHQKDKICQVKRKKKSRKDPNIDKKLQALLADLTLSPSLSFTSL